MEDTEPFRPLGNVFRFQVWQLRENNTSGCGGLCDLQRLSVALWLTHSVLSATIGSTLVARRAGSQHAVIATPASNTATLENVSGSRELT